MSQLRYDPVTTDWVIYAPSRALRPHPLPSPVSVQPTATAHSPCPFCPGNEAFTPPKIYVVRGSGLLKPLAQLLRAVLLKLYTALGNPSFNLTIDSVSRGDESKEYFMWHLRILPRLTTRAGFEMGSGMSINTVMPEDARNFLSEVATVEYHAQKPSAVPVHA